MRNVSLHTRVIALIAAFALLSAICPLPASAAGKLQIMTATTDLAALAQEIGGDRVEVESVARGYQDPHFVEAKPSFLLKLRHADLLIVVGLELEIGWLPPLISQSTNPKIQVGAPGYFDASRFAKILEIPTGVVTRAEGDVHPLGNPHYWLDPENGLRIAKGIQIPKTAFASPRGFKIDSLKCVPAMPPILLSAITLSSSVSSKLMKNGWPR